jgi:hypothetical protein
MACSFKQKGEFTPLESPSIYAADGRNRKHQLLIEGGVKALPFLKGFTPSISAIKILDKKNEVGYFISLAEKSDGENLSFVVCRECVRYCPVSGDIEKVIGA